MMNQTVELNEEFFTTCVDKAEVNKSSFITLINVFVDSQQVKEVLTSMVASADWDIVNETYWNEFWDGDFDNLNLTICEAFNRFYPLY